MRYSFALCGLLLVAQAAADEATAKKLVDLAPRFSPDDPSLRSMRFKGDMSLGAGRFVFDVAMDRPAHNMLLLTDGRDGTPFLWLADGRILVYDPGRQHVIVSDPGHAVPQVTFKMEGENLKGDWGYDNHLGAHGLIDIDLKSLVSGLAQLEARRESASSFTLTGKSPHGNQCSAQIDTSKPCPYRALEITGKDVHIRVNEIHRNEPIAPDCWRFPSLEELKRHVPVVMWDDLSLAGVMRAQAATGLAIPFRHDIADPKFREVWEQNFGRVDWEAAGKSDAKISAALRRVLADCRTAPSTEKSHAP